MANTYRTSTIQNNFTGGELSPRLNSRSDLDVYKKGCKTLENFIVWPHGGVTRRPGTKYISTAGNPNYAVKLIPFIYSETQAYVLEFGHQYMRVYTNGGQVTQSGTAYEISTNFDYTDLSHIKYVQNADVIYFATPNVRPQKLERYGHTDWRMSDVDFQYGPLLDENTNINYEVTPSAVTGTITLTANTGIFDTDHVDSVWGITGTMKETANIGAENTFTSDIVVDGGESPFISLNGTWVGTVTVQRSLDNGSTWLDYYQYTSNITVSYEEIQDGVRYRVGIKSGDYTSGTVNAEVGKVNYTGFAKITAVSGTTVASGTVTRELPSTDATYKWSEGAWSDLNGWPSSVAFYEERLIWAGNDYRPQTVWSSQVDDYENYLAGTTDDDAYVFSLVSNDINTLHSMVNSGQYLHIFTLGGEWSFGSSSASTTPTNANAIRETTVGSTNIQALPIGHVLLYLQKNGRKLMQRSYTYENESWISIEISKLSEHLLKDGITEMSYCRQPDNILWMTTASGDLISATYEPQEKILAFAKHSTQGEFESICSIPSSDRDELWAVVKRTTSSGVTRYVEQFQTTEWNDIGDSCYLDSAIEYNGTAATTFSGADHLEGLSCGITLSGAVHPNVTVSGGSFSLQYDRRDVMLGLTYDAILETMPLEINLKSGTSQSKKKRVANVNIRVKDSLGFEIGSTESNTAPIPLRTSADFMDQAPGLKSDWYEFFIPGGHKKDFSIYCKSSQPVPISILSLVFVEKVSDY